MQDRNGGHIFPPLHDDYVEIKAKYGAIEAAKFVRMRLQHIQELIAVAKEEGASEVSQAREVNGLDVYLAEEPYREAKARFEAWAAEMPEEAKGISCVEGKEAIEVRANFLYLKTPFFSLFYSRNTACHLMWRVLWPIPQVQFIPTDSSLPFSPAYSMITKGSSN